MTEAILFDYDGVLVNSMPFHVQAWQEIFTDYNIAISPEEVLLREGSRAIELARDVLSEHKIDISEDLLAKLVKKKQDTYRSISRAQIFPEAESILTEFKQGGMLLGLVTGSERRNIEFSASEEFISLFDVIISNDETRNGKPNPECYLKAAEALNLSPEQCLVVENAPLGIQAAKRAGMRVVALSTTLPRKHLPGADYYFDDLEVFKKTYGEIKSLKTGVV